MGIKLNMDITIDQNLRDIQRQYLDFLDDDVRVSIKKAILLILP